MKDKIDSKIHEYYSQYPKRSYAKGQIILFANENPDHIYYIVKGIVRKYDVTYRGDEVVVNIFKSPSFFPMSWAINQSPNKYFYKAETPTDVRVIPVKDALEFITANNDVMLDLLSRVYSGADGLHGRVVHLMSGSAKCRLIYELLIESRRFGKKQPDGSYSLQTSGVDIAARSGLSRETVSRELKKLKSEGLISIEKGGMVVHDIEALEKFHC